MLEQALSNLHWAVAFNIATGVLNIACLSVALVCAVRMRRAAKMLREAAENYRQNVAANSPSSCP